MVSMQKEKFKEAFELGLEGQRWGNAKGKEMRAQRMLRTHLGEK
jgi:hypothetical protein